MPEAPTLTIRRDWPRPSAAELEPFRDATTAWVADAQARRGALHHAIRPVTKATRLLGPALPVYTRPRDNLAPYAALSVAKPGDVLVVAAEGYEGAALIGDSLLGYGRNAGIAGCVTDSLVRDLPGIEPLGIPVFARGVTPGSPVKDGPGMIGLPVVLGGVAVEAGDLIIGDGDGVVVVPRARIGDVAAALAGIRAAEARGDAAIAAGATQPAWLAERLARPDISFVE
jgi:4-hydroxy-4-methyl-2-oxoglutarate aldolase